MRVAFFFILALVALVFLALNTGVWEQAIIYIYDQQQRFHRQLAEAVRAVKQSGTGAIWGLVVISFLYGIFHAAGPGHGKAIITTYIATHESQLKRAMALSFAASLLQGISAIVIVGGVLVLAGQHRDAHMIAKYAEQFSFALVVAIGLTLIYRVLSAFWKKKSTHHKHYHDGHHDHHREACSSCGHSHAIDIHQFKGKTHWRDTLAVIASVGIRPCSGSVLVLIFSAAIGLHIAGIGAVMAISLGTAITVSALAFIAVRFRNAALLISNKTAGIYAENIFLLISVLGGIVISLLGTSLFVQSISNQHPLF